MKRYPWKSSPWFLLFLVIYNLFPPCVYFFWEGGTALSASRWLAFFVCFYAVDIIWLVMLLGNRVDLLEDRFVVHCSLSKLTYAITDVIRMEKLEKSFVAPERILMVTKRKKFYLSLKDCDGFMAAIRQAQAKAAQQ